MPQLVMEGTKILSMIFENLHFLDLFNFLPFTSKSMPKSFDSHAKKGNVPTFSTLARIGIVVSYPEPKYYEANYTPGDGRVHFSNGMESKKTKFFITRQSSLPNAWTLMY